MNNTDDHLSLCRATCPGFEVQVTDESGNPLETVKEVSWWRAGSNVMRGYWNNEPETRPP